MTHIVIKYDFIEVDATSHSFSATCLICIWFCECWNYRIRTGAQQPTHLLSLQEFRELFTSLSDEEQRTETARFITRTLTEALLAVTTELIDGIVEEVMTEAVSGKSHVLPSEDSPSVEIKSPILGLVSYNSESESESEQNVLESKLPTNKLSGILPGDVPDDVKHDYTSQNSPSNENNKIVTGNGKFQTAQEKNHEKHSYSSSIHQKSKRYKNEKETDMAVTISRSRSKHSHKRRTNSRHSHRSRKRDFRGSSTASSESSSSNHGNQKVGFSRFSRSSADHIKNVRSPKHYFAKSSHSKHSHHKSHH